MHALNSVVAVQYFPYAMHIAQYFPYGTKFTIDYYNFSFQEILLLTCIHKIELQLNESCAQNSIEKILCNEIVHVG